MAGKPTLLCGYNATRHGVRLPAAFGLEEKHDKFAGQIKGFHVSGLLVVLDKWRYQPTQVNGWQTS